MGRLLRDIFESALQRIQAFFSGKAHDATQGTLDSIRRSISKMFGGE